MVKYLEVSLVKDESLNSITVNAWCLSHIPRGCYFSQEGGLHLTVIWLIFSRYSIFVESINRLTSRLSIVTNFSSVAIGSVLPR